MAEQLALDQARGDRAAVHLHQRPLLARAAVVDGAGDEFLAGAGFAGRSARWNRSARPARPAAALEQGGTAADDFAEVVLAADFFLEIDVLRFEPRLLLLHQHALGDVDEHRAREGAAGVGSRPPLNPERFAVVLAAQFQHDAAGVDALADGLEGFAQSALRVRRIGHEISSVGAFNFLGRDAKDSHRRAVGADELGIETLVDVGDRRFVEEIASRSSFSCNIRFHLQHVPTQRRPARRTL